MVDVVVDNYKTTYNMAGSDFGSTRIQARLDGIVRNIVPVECERIISATFPDNFSLYFVKNMRVDLSLNVAGQDDLTIASTWAGNIADSLRQTLHHRVDHNNVKVFQNKIDYLTSFLIDLLKGIAWQQWYYREFEHLRKLDTRQAIMETLKDNNLFIEDILLTLMDNLFLDRLINKLAQDDIKTIFENYLNTIPRYGSKGHEELVSLLVNLIDEDNMVISKGNYLDYRSYLVLFLRAIRKYPDLRNVVSLRKAVKFTFLLRYCTASMKSDEEFERAQRLQDITDLISFIRNETGAQRSDIAMLLTELDNDEGKQALLEIAKYIGKKVKATSEKKLITDYGGIFIFNRIILDNNLHQLINNSQFPSRSNLSGINAFLFCLGQKLAGYHEILSKITEPGLLLFAGYRSPPSPGMSKDYIENITSEMNDQFLESLLPLIPENMKYGNINHLSKSSEVDFHNVIDITAELLYRLFAIRLGNFRDSSSKYLFENFIHRQAEIIIEQDSIRIILSSKPLDLVLRISGILSDIENVPWLDNRRLEFILEH